MMPAVANLGYVPMVGGVTTQHIEHAVREFQRRVEGGTKVQGEVHEAAVAEIVGQLRNFAVDMHLVTMGPPPRRIIRAPIQQFGRTSLRLVTTQ